MAALPAALAASVCASPAGCTIRTRRPVRSLTRTRRGTWVVNGRGPDVDVVVLAVPAYALPTVVGGGGGAAPAPSWGACGGGRRPRPTPCAWRRRASPPSPATRRLRLRRSGTPGRRWRTRSTPLASSSPPRRPCRPAARCSASTLRRRRMGGARPTGPSWSPPMRAATAAPSTLTRSCATCGRSWGWRRRRSVVTAAARRPKRTAT
ncbi:hypothetical protein BU14_0103s0060 [Porphyra umbilicalis]|uniref:Amine oxidase domain-containing protein n=1 Tax=Porphyra umbilicalis TaxID=2786 RepID=A0A1X6PCX0_PORUM|nr:hypothetical protein BU14_0103s0060 [Porphyra umbilicalis]|eukprot:OSX78717.1 hypothetical protein BU14_0103s0060 [Porphyra umbilicalis]